LKKSLFNRFLLASLGVWLLAFLALWLTFDLGNLNQTAFIVIFLLAVGLNLWLYRALISPFHQTLEAIDNGISAFRDNDFSLAIHNKGYSETSKIVGIYNELAAVLRAERMDIFQRELLLDTVIQSTPVALMLTNISDKIVYSNLAAKELAGIGKKLEGYSLDTVLSVLPSHLAQAIANKQNGLVTLQSGLNNQIYHCHSRQFTLNGRHHELYLIKNMTTDISKKETQMWKQVIRLISHELNNSLAPIASLTKSAKQIIEQPEHMGMLADVLDTIGSRTKHLHEFIVQYAKFAKMPEPVPEKVELGAFIESLALVLNVKIQSDVLSEAAYFDRAQIEQVLINLVKNAKESGSELEDVEVKLVQRSNILECSVLDRGQGIEENKLSQVLLPFFTTKTSGSGIGLALCNEVINAHQGKLTLSNRKQGGLRVLFTLPIR